jgi:hypothetical protein
MGSNRPLSRRAEPPCGHVPETAVFTPYTITIRITASCARVEISKPCGHEPGAWLAILATIADRFGSFGATDGEQTLWAEVALRGPSTHGSPQLDIGDNPR